MALLKDPLIGDIKPKAIKGLLDNKAREIAEKGTNISNLDLYNLCLINKEREQIEKDA